MPTKRDIIEQLKREELQRTVEHYKLEVGDRRVRGDLIDAIIRARKARIVDVLADLSRDRLKELCQALEVDGTGKEKSTLIDRLCGETSPSDDGVDLHESSNEAAQLLGRLLSETLVLSEAQDAWPSRGALSIGAHTFDVSIYARIVGGSSRGNLLERRFQNPSQRSPIVDDPDRHELLFGLWIEQGMERAVIVAFDVLRRLDRSTRFSLFMPLSLLEQTADTGFATHENGRGETLYAFRPENIGRYIQTLLDDDMWRPQHANGERPKAPRAVASKVAEAPQVDGSIYIRPRVGMYAAFARLNYKPWFALAEFVDNSIQSFLHNQTSLEGAGHEGPLVIDVNLDDNEISVTDRAGGIAWKDFPRAFSPAAPPDDPSGLSEFGLGMKAAACWFSRKWSVRTSALGEAAERLVTFDVPKISSEGLENLPIETRSARESDHFTVVTMQDLRVQLRGRTLAKIKEHLRSIYRVLMKDGVVRLRLTVGGTAEELSYQEPELLVAPYHRAKSEPARLWRGDFVVDLNDRRVTGWAGILKAGSHSKAGFSVFRRRRLIEGSAGEKYKPSAIFGSPNSFASQRVVGELFVEGFDVTHTKDGIQWHGYEDDVLQAILRQIDCAVFPLLDQAEGYRVRKTADTLPSYFGIQALETTASALSTPEASGIVREEGEKTGAVELSHEEPLQAPVLQQTNVKIAVRHGAEPWDLHLELVRDRAAPFYRISTSSDDARHVVRAQVNLDHEFSIAFINGNEATLQPILRFVAAHALGEKLAREAAIRNPGFVRQRANEILRCLTTDEAGDK